jgi:hypothetical protein
MSYDPPKTKGIHHHRSRDLGLARASEAAGTRLSLQARLWPGLWTEVLLSVLPLLYGL